jgi:hypothetical protein
LSIASPLLASPLFVSAAMAQDPSVELTAARTSGQAVAREIDCLRGIQRELSQTVRLLEEAVAQRQVAPREAARRDAELAARSLRQRRAEILQRIDGCRQEYSVPSLPTQVVEQPPSQAELQVAQPNDATQVIEQNVRLSQNTFIVIGERVDGRGLTDPVQVRNSLRSVSALIDRCYDQVVRRGALVRGELILTFTLTPTGRVSRSGVERNSMPAAFGRCVQRAARQIRAPTAVRGGDATLAYHLRFPDEGGAATSATP